MSKRKVLIIDDEPDMQETLLSILKKKYSPVSAGSGKEGVEKVKNEDFALVLLDLRMPKMDGIETLKKIRENDPALPVVVVTASKDIKSAVDSIKGGAQDYITKPFEVEELLLVVEQNLEKQKLVKENTSLKQALNDENYMFCDLIGRSPQIKKVMEMIDSIKGADSTVLIHGESGTGKEIVAKAIHKTSRRSDQPFIAVNCAAIPENLIESELFGHERGAFTGALERRTGKFEMADGGTLFLDEIGCMPASMQSKLLRVLEDKMIERVGGGRPFGVDVRIISATNIDFQAAIANRSFREDLFYRLNVIPINLPALKDRKEDIPLFIEYFTDKFNKILNRGIKSFSDDALELLYSYGYPGNVRELQNIIERMVAISREDTISAEDLACLTDIKPSSSYYAPDLSQPLHSACQDFEKYYVSKVLENCGGNQSEAARILGVARSTLHSRMSALGIK
ncbi:MAG: sigma-54 dependent transcriptional regulator [Candidatus Margulisiibacteriota bacterium]